MDLFLTTETLMSIIGAEIRRIRASEANYTKDPLFSTLETIIYIDRANLWTNDCWTPGEPKVFGYAVTVREGMNVMCLCHTRDSEE